MTFAGRLSTLFAKNRIVQTFKYYRSFGPVRLNFSEEDLIKNAIKRAFLGRHRSFTITQLEADELCEQVLTELGKLGSTPIRELIEKRQPEIISDALHRYSLVTSQAALFEIKAKFTMHKMGVQVFQGTGTRPEYRRISRIVADFVQMYPMVIVDFEYIARLRDSLTHGNFLQLRDMVEPRLAPEELAECQANVVAFNLASGGAPVHADDLRDVATSIEQGPFFWFLAEGNTRLLRFVAEHIEKGIAALDDIGQFHALCFGDAENFFGKVAVEGAGLTQPERNIFLENGRTFLGENPDLAVDKMLGRFRVLPN